MNEEVKKAFLSTVAFLLCITCCTAIIMYPRDYVYDHPNETELRQELAGTLEMLISGASQGRYAFDTDILDEQLGTKSYNLARDMMNMRARYFVLNKELNRNPVKTVIVELASDALQRNDNNLGINWETLTYLDSFEEKLEFLHFQGLTFRDVVQSVRWLFSQALENGLQGWALIPRKGQYDHVAEAERDRQALTYYLAGSHEVALSKEDFTRDYRGADQQIPYPFQKDTCDYFKKSIEAGKEKGARVIICKLPESEASTLTYGFLDELDAYLKDLANTYQCEYYNFELIRNKPELFPEKYAFLDLGHLSRSGHETFTKLFCDVIESDHPEEYFWDTYEEAALHGSYAEWVKEIEAEKSGAPGAEANGEEQGQEI